MPRAPRLQIPGGIYHLGCRGVRREAIYTNSGDYELFGDIFWRVVQRFEWRCHTYCLMPNHYHLLLETPAPNLSAGMQRLNSTYAQWYNELYGFSGHVFERRFFSRLVESSYDLLELVRYIMLNPVRAGICDDASGWRWSSYRALAGEARRAPFLTCDWLLAQFGRDLGPAREAFCTFIREAPLRARSC
jgi:putative transposase